MRYPLRLRTVVRDTRLTHRRRTRRGLSRGWVFTNPASLNGLFCWYDASDTASFTLSGSDVTAWADLSANARHLNLVTGTPSRTGTQNGLTTVLVAAGESVHRAQTVPLGTGACSVFTVVKIDSVITGFVVTEGATGDDTNTFRPVESVITTGSFRFGERAGGGDVFDADAVDITAALKVLRTTDTGTSVERAVDGVSTGAAFSHSLLNPVTNRFALGALLRATPVFSTGTIEYAEVVAYNRVLDAAEITLVEDYLTDKWIGAGATPLLVDDATHGHTVEAVTLTQHQVLTVADATHSHTAANVALTQHQVLTVAAATHAHTAGATVLTQHQVLAVANATHAHTVEAVALTQHQVLAVADSTHAHSAANVTLGVGVVTLVVADTVHGHTAEAVSLTQHQVLTVADATHGHTAATIALTQHHVLTVAAATHGHSAANVTLGVAGVLDVHPATHGHTAGAVVLTQHHVLTVANATHGHSAANVTLTVGVVTLTVANATHSHTAAAVVLVQHQVLVVADTVHAHSVAAVALTQHHLLAVADARHFHTAAEVAFFSSVWSLLRRRHVRAEIRIPLVVAEDRIPSVRAENRIPPVEAP